MCNCTSENFEIAGSHASMRPGVTLSSLSERAEMHVHDPLRRLGHLDGLPSPPTKASTVRSPSRDMLPTSAMLMWMGCPVSDLVHSIQNRMAFSFVRDEQTGQFVL